MVKISFKSLIDRDDSFVRSTNEIYHARESYVCAALFIGVPPSYTVERLGEVWEHLFISTIDDTDGLIVMVVNESKDGPSHDNIVALKENSKELHIPKYTFIDSVRNRKEVISQIEDINLCDSDENGGFFQVGIEHNYRKRRDNYPFENPRDLIGSYRFIIIVGEAGIGKTTLAKRLLDFNEANVIHPGDIIIDKSSGRNVILENFDHLSEKLIGWLMKNIEGYVIITTSNKEIIGEREEWKVIELTSKPYVEVTLEHSRIQFP